MIFHQSARKKIRNFFHGFLLYLPSELLRDNDLRGAFFEHHARLSHRRKSSKAQSHNELMAIWCEVNFVPK